MNSRKPALVSMGDRIVSSRGKLGISASEFARRVRVTPTAVWNWEKNGIIPRGPAISTIAVALGVSEEYLRTGIESVSTEVNSSEPVTVAEAIDRAKREIGKAAGLSSDRVKLTVEFI